MKEELLFVGKTLLLAREKFSFQTTGIIILFFFLTSFGLKVHASEHLSEGKNQQIDSGVAFDHKEHETYEFTCRECHHADINSCLDCHDFEEHSELEMPVEDIDEKGSCMTCHEPKQYDTVYRIVTGPLAWLSFLIFFIGILVRAILYIKGLDSTLDRVTYRVNTTHGIKGALKSVFYWLLPFGTRSWRTHPGMTLLFFIFHFCLLFTPVFLEAHNIILKERWGFSFSAIPEIWTDYLTIAVMVLAVALILRRIVLKHVRIITKFSDYLVLAITVAPFITGFLAFHGVSNYSFWLISHILTGEIMLIAVPFTKLSHCFLFFFSRAQLGMDYGIKRGGMKGRGKAW